MKSADVSPEVTLLAGSVRAKRASVRLLTNVDGFLVTYQRVLLTETAIALITLIKKRGAITIKKNKNENNSSLNKENEVLIKPSTGT